MAAAFFGGWVGALFIHSPRFRCCVLLLSAGTERTLLCVCVFMCMCVCMCGDAVFRKTKQRQRARLDPGCIRLWSEGAPSGSLEGKTGAKEAGKNKEMLMCVAVNYISRARFSKVAFL